MEKIKISMFSTDNDTDKYAVCVDGYFELFETSEEANRVYELTGGVDGEDGASGTPFGSVSLLPPHNDATNIFGQPAESKISSFSPIKMEKYIRTGWKIYRQGGRK